MQDLALWRILQERPLPIQDALPLLAELGTSSLHVRLPFFARLLSLTKHESPQIRAATLRALGGASGASVFQALVTGLYDRLEEVRLAALDGLQASCHDDPPRIAHALFHRDPQLRRAALQGISNLSAQWLTVYLLPDGDNVQKILDDLPASGLPTDSLPAVFDMLAAGSISSGYARDVLLRMRPNDLFERLCQGRARAKDMLDYSLNSFASLHTPPATSTLAANDDAFDDAIDLFLAASDEQPTAGPRFCSQLIEWLGQARLEPRNRVACSLLRRYLLDGRASREALRALCVAWPPLVGCAWLPAPERRDAALVFYDLKDKKLPQLPAQELKDLLDRAAPVRRSSNLDLRLLGALGRLLADSPLKQMLEWYGVGRITAAFEEDWADSAPFLTLPCESSEIRRGLVDAICADKRPRLPKILAALLHQLPADLFDVLDPLSPYEVAPLLLEMHHNMRADPELGFSDPRAGWLAQVLALRIALFHSAYQSRRVPRGAALIDVINLWMTLERSPLDAILGDVLFHVARELPAELLAGHLLRLSAEALCFLLVELNCVELLSLPVERQLRESLASHSNAMLRAWASLFSPQKKSDTTRSEVRELSPGEKTRFAKCTHSELTLLLSVERNVALSGLADSLARRGGVQPRTVLAAESILACDDDISSIDSALDKFLPMEPKLLAELDNTLVARCRAQMSIGLGAHLWLYRWEEHLEAVHRKLQDANETLADLLTVALTLQTPLLTEHCFRAAAAMLAQWRFRDKPKFREQATRELGGVLVNALPGPFGEFAARMLICYVHVGVADTLLAELRAGVVRQLPDIAIPVRQILSDWISSSGLGTATRQAAQKRAPAADLLQRIRHSRILEHLAAWAASDDLDVADEAILRLLELGEVGVTQLAELLEQPNLPPAAVAIIATITLWPDCEPLQDVQKLVQSRRLPPDLQFDAALSLVDRGEHRLIPLAISAVLADIPYSWFKPAHWQRLAQHGFTAQELSRQLITSPQPHAYITSVNTVIAHTTLLPAAAHALERFLEQGNNRANELRVGAARRLQLAGNLIGFPVLLAQETAKAVRCHDLLSAAELALVLETVDTMLAAGPRHARETVLLSLLMHKRVDAISRETALRHLLVHGQNEAVRTQVLANLARTVKRDVKLRRVAQSFAWGVQRARELTGKLFSVELLAGEDLGFTRFEQPKIHINALPILRGEAHGEDIVRGLILHELGHHMFHADEIGKRTWKQAQEDRLFRLLNLVSDEHLERNLRAQDSDFGDPLKRLAAYAFQHAQKELPVASLLAGLQGRAFAVLTRLKLAAARKPGHVAIESGAVLRELERTEHSFARFVRALRMGLGNRHADPLVNQGLELFRGNFRHSTMPQLLDVTRELQRIFGWQVSMLDVLSQDSLASGDPTETTIAGEGISNDELQREVKRILDPKQQRNLNRAGTPGGLWINVNPDEAFAPITTIEQVPYEPEKHREYSQLVRRPAFAMRTFFEQLGLAHVEQRHRLQGRAFDRSRALPMVIRAEPRVLIARQLVSKTDLFLGVVIDCSGSMQSGNNIEKARRFGELLAQAVNGLRGIDLRVFGFTDRVIYDAGDAVRCSVHGLVAGGGNNDAAALWHAAQEALRSRRRAKLLVMISDGLPTECSAAALKALVHRITNKLKMCCAQVAVRPIEEACFPNYIQLDEADLDGSVKRFGRIIVDLVRKTLHQ